MQQLMSMNSNQTMTSKELVEVINAIRKEEGNNVEIQHSDLMRRIKGFERILAAGSVAGDEYLDNIGQMRPMLLLNKEACLLTVSSESPRVNLAIIRRWQQLEQQQQAALPQTHIEAVEAYLITLKTVEAQSKQLGIQAVVISQQSGLLVQQKEVIDYKKIITGEGEEYFPISLILEHNEDRTFSGRRLTIFSAKAEIDPIPMFASKGQIPVKAYHWSVWEAAYPNVILPE